MAYVGTSFVKRGKVGNAKAKDTIRYIQHRTGKDNERVWRPLFTGDGPMSRQEAYQFIDEAPKGTKFFTIIISPDPEREDTNHDLDAGNYHHYHANDCGDHASPGHHDPHQLGGSGA